MCEEEKMFEEKSMDEIWDLAIRNAVDAFDKTFEEYNLDAAFWSIEVVSNSLSSDFDYVLATKTFSNMEFKLRD